MFLTGVLQALGLTFCLAFLNVFLRVAVNEWQVQPIIFTCVCLMTSALVLSLAGGPGRLTKDTLKSPATWLYSILLMSAYVTDVYIMQYLSATEASFYSRLTIPLALISAWVLHKRLPHKNDLIGLAIVCGALVWLTILQPAASFFMIVSIVTVGAFIQTALCVIAETHKEAVAASETGTIRDKARVVGFVTFVSSATFLFAALCLGGLFAMMQWDTSHTYGLVPNLSGFIHPPTVAAAIFYGIVILPFIRYLKWGASYNLKAENLFVILAFIPVVTMGLERLVGALIDLPVNTDIFAGSRGHQLIVIAILMTFGAGLTAFLRIREQVQQLPKDKSLWEGLKEAMSVDSSRLAIHHSDTAQDDYDMIESTLEFTHGDHLKAADLLQIPATTLLVLQQGKGTLALTQEASNELARNYRKNVTSRDGLTGLYNRNGFLAEVKKTLEEQDFATLLFLDLNKFKPVNDTYGHEAGDAILTGVGKRLQALFPEPHLLTRLGGDEFCVLLAGVNKTAAKKQVTALQKEIAKTFLYEGNHVEIGASVGMAEYPTDATEAEDLLKFADEGMYREKKER